MTTSSNFTALIVDDNYYNRDLVALALKHIQYEVMEAEDGASALKLLDQRSYNLLVLDLAMPSMDGTQVLSEVRKNPQHLKMCVLVMTANPHMVTPGVDVEADYIMYKPISISEFVEFAGRLKRQMQPAS
jgi:DNA-binding response OmpR family regulator